MRHQFMLEYWRDGDWFVGRLVEVPGVFSQGSTLEELDENIQDAYEMMAGWHALAQREHGAVATESHAHPA